MKILNKRIWIALFFISTAVLLQSCKKDSDVMSPAELVKHHKLAGTYRAQITPAFIGTSPVATSEHDIHIEDLGNGKIRLSYEKFRAAPMPFEMSVSIVISVSQGSGNTLLLEGKEGSFRAIPPDGDPIDPDDIPSGIELPDGAEAGMSSDQASIKGTYGEIQKDGHTAWRYDLNLTPGIALPIQVLIYTHPKID